MDHHSDRRSVAAMIDVKAGAPGAAPADAVAGHWTARAPEFLRPFLQLSRFDRPVGFWLLAQPCWMGLALAALAHGFAWSQAGLAIGFGLGAVAMRGAGCTYNDIVDRRIDARVARTAARPLAAGTLGLGAAWFWLALQLALGAAVFFCLPRAGKVAALAAIPVVALYPFMKRVVFFPQFFLGAAFASGVLIGFVSIAGQISLAVAALTLAVMFWVMGYDTIYALQDVADDQKAGVKSTALWFGRAWGLAVLVIYGAATGLSALAIGLVDRRPLAPLAVLPFALHLILQLRRARGGEPAAVLAAFRSNVSAGFLLVGGILLVAAFPGM